MFKVFWSSDDSMFGWCKAGVVPDGEVILLTRHEAVAQSVVVMLGSNFKITQDVVNQLDELHKPEEWVLWQDFTYQAVRAGELGQGVIKRFRGTKAEVELAADILNKFPDVPPAYVCTFVRSFGGKIPDGVVVLKGPNHLQYFEHYLEIGGE